MTENVKPVLKWSWRLHTWKVKRGIFEGAPRGWAVRPPKVCPLCRSTQNCGGSYPHYCRECREKAAAAVSRLARRAITLVGVAVRLGALPRLDGSIICVDCNERPAKVYDHREYGKPLDVAPVCRRCNSLRGPAKDVAHLLLKALPRWTA